MSFKPYPKYKESGVEWLGRVPEHWEVNRFKWSVSSCRNGIWGDEAKGDENDIPCVRVADFDRQRLRVELAEPTIRNISTTERQGRVLERGDLLLEKSGGGELNPVGCVVLYDDAASAICSNFIARMRLKSEADSSFCRYLHSAAYAVRLNVRSIKQTSGIQNLDQQQYLDERATFPPLAEQQVVGAFLDRETAKIDALIAEQQRLIELLQEKRQAVISHAVTKGLNPDAPMKDSRIEWLGEVPEHWEVVRLKNLVRSRNGIQMGPFGGMLKELEHEPTPYKLFGQQNTINDDFDVGQRWLTEACFCSLKEYELLPGDLVLTRKGASIGYCRVVPDGISKGIIDSDTIRVRVVPERISNAFAVSLMQEGYLEKEILYRQKGSVLPGLNSSVISNLSLALPPPHEQAAICHRIVTVSEEIDGLCDSAQHSIALLQERRSALISAAVTGQIDVRGFSGGGSEAA